MIFVIGYLIGSLSFSNWFATRFAKTDLLSFGSKNAGASNVGQLLGTKVMVVVGCLDLGKGAISLWVGRYLDLSTDCLVLLGSAVITGHCWSCFLHFRGGRGIASLTGVILGLGWFNVVGTSLLIASIGLICGNRPVFVALAVSGLPLLGLIFDKNPLGLTLLAAIIFVKRILGHTLIPESPDGMLRGYVRRMIFDRDVISNIGWIRREDE